MKYFLKKTLSIAIAALFSFGAGTYVHAQTVQDGQLAFSFPSLQSVFESHIRSDRENAAKNRDERNTLLEAKTDASASDASSSVALVNGLSLSLSNLENIESRIDARTADVAGQGNDVSGVTGPLSEASQELDTASTTLASIDPSATDPAAFASSTDAAAQALTSAKYSLESALDALKEIVGN